MALGESHRFDCRLRLTTNKQTILGERRLDSFSTVLLSTLQHLKELFRGQPDNFERDEGTLNEVTLDGDKGKRMTSLRELNQGRYRAREKVQPLFTKEESVHRDSPQTHNEIPVTQICERITTRTREPRTLMHDRTATCARRLHMADLVEIGPTSIWYRITRQHDDQSKEQSQI